MSKLRYSGWLRPNCCRGVHPPRALARASCSSPSPWTTSPDGHTARTRVWSTFPLMRKLLQSTRRALFERIHWFTCGTARNTSGALAFAPGSFSALHPMSTDETRERASLRDFPPSKKRVSMKGLHERSRACAAASTTFSSSASSLHVSPRSLLPPSLTVPASLNFFT